MAPANDPGSFMAIDHSVVSAGEGGHRLLHPQRMGPTSASVQAGTRPTATPPALRLNPCNKAGPGLPDTRLENPPNEARFLGRELCAQRLWPAQSLAAAVLDIDLGSPRPKFIA